MNRMAGYLIGALAGIGAVIAGLVMAYHLGRTHEREHQAQAYDDSLEELEQHRHAIEVATATRAAAEREALDAIDRAHAQAEMCVPHTAAEALHEAEQAIEAAQSEAAEDDRRWR